MVKIQVDGKIYEAKPEKNLLETCLAIGLIYHIFATIRHWVQSAHAGSVQ